jgi:hypothetical protein
MNDSLIRSFLCLLRSRPCGSVPGLIAWEFWKAFSRRGREFDKRASARSISALRSTSLRAPSDFETERDAYFMREAYVALLSPDEQRKLHETFGFDPIKWGYWTAGTIAAVAGGGFFASASAIARGEGTVGKWVSALSAALLFAEQVVRFVKILSGAPAGSVLGALVRPWCRKLLSVKPRALAPGSIAPAERNLPDIWEGDPPDE